MEYLEGITLKQYIRENQRITLEELVRLLVPLIESLDEIHSQGMIHRDISPDNIPALERWKGFFLQILYNLLPLQSPLTLFYHLEVP